MLDYHRKDDREVGKRGMKQSIMIEHFSTCFSAIWHTADLMNAFLQIKEKYFFINV